jgi:molybdate transport system permease protein
VMWRVSPRAIAVLPEEAVAQAGTNGARHAAHAFELNDANRANGEGAGSGLYRGTLERIELRHGDRYAVLDVGGHCFDVGDEHAFTDARRERYVRIDPRGVSAWPLAEAGTGMRNTHA